MALGIGGIDMWTYEKKLQYPVKIKCPNPAIAKVIITQVGGPDGELAASMRYLSQRYSMPYKQAIGVLNDIGTEELAHLEMVSAIVHQLTRNMTMEQIKASGFDTYFVDHTAGIYPQAASGMPFTAAVFQSKGDAITDLVEDMAADAAPLKRQLLEIPIDFNLPFSCFWILFSNTYVFNQFLNDLPSQAGYMNVFLNLLSFA